METIKEAKKYLKTNWRKGSRCPCCGQFVKLYRRAINHSVGASLIRLAKLAQEDGDRFYHIHEISGKSKILTAFTSGGDLAKAAHWDLIEQKENTDEDKKCSGYWKITQEGIDFVNDKIEIRKYALLYNSKCHGLEGGYVSIHDILGNKFNYNELMRK